MREPGERIEVVMVAQKYDAYVNMMQVQLWFIPVRYLAQLIQLPTRDQCLIICISETYLARDQMI